MSGELVLLIDDDPTLRELLSDHLQVAGYRVIACADGRDGLHLIAEKQPNLIVLDLMMPGLDGWEVCKELRGHSSTPIIILTAKSEEIDKLRGFHLGIDDYVTKPFSFAELTARIGAVLARTYRTPATVHSLTSRDLTIDFDHRRVTVAGQPIELTPTEYRLLETLAHQANQTIASEHLTEVVWGPGYIGEVEQVKHFIWSLRKKIEADPGDPSHLITERGFGYRFE